MPHVCSGACVRAYVYIGVYLLTCASWRQSAEEVYACICSKCAVCDGLWEVLLHRQRVQAAEKKAKHLEHTQSRRASNVCAPMMIISIVYDCIRIRDKHISIQVISMQIDALIWWWYYWLSMCTMCVMYIFIGGVHVMIRCNWGCIYGDVADFFSEKKNIKQLGGGYYGKIANSEMKSHITTSTLRPNIFPKSSKPTISIILGKTKKERKSHFSPLNTYTTYIATVFL